MADVTDLFFHVSGEHTTLPYAEVKAILDAEGHYYRKSTSYPQLICLQSDINALSAVAKRSGFTRTCGVVIVKCEPCEAMILRAVKNVNYNPFFKKGETFSVKVKKVMRPKISAQGLENAIGRNILKTERGPRVNLTKPDVSFFGHISPDIFVLGQKMYDVPRNYLNRKASDRPFSHPSSMSSKLARALVNLARIKRGGIVLDPFCGTGSILIEAGLMGYRVIGSEINPRMVRGTMRNLKYFNVPWTGLAISDGQRLPYSNVDGIVTDPPYGRASSTHGTSTRQIVRDFLVAALNVLPKGGYISIALPDTLGTREISKGLGYINVETHHVREHKSLTRELLVIRKPQE